MSTNKLSLTSPISDLYSKKSKTVEKLNSINIETVEDLLWVLPKKIVRLPDVAAFKFANIGSYFRGLGHVVSVQARPNFKARGKGRASLYNITANVQDKFSGDVLSLKFFNCYGSVKSKIESLKEIEFLGVVSEFNGVVQIANPEFNSPESFAGETGLKIQYPTIASVSTVHLKKVIDKIPAYLWLEIEENLPKEIIEKHSLFSRQDAFRYLHGKIDIEKWNEADFEKSKERLIYEEFFNDQVKINLRKKSRKSFQGIQLGISQDELVKSESLYPYELTDDQKSTLKDVISDMDSGTPMMRLVQGDVGCGKTTVAVLASYLTIKKGYQAALMCPTESLAQQHYESINKVLPDGISIALLLGSSSTKEKNQVLEGLKNGTIEFIIGTHSLFQDSVEFKNLGLSIIDEQHKFGVEQRLKLVGKGAGSHCLIMSATPIPRSLSLTQYGDLDISIIKTMPSGRKGSQTRIVTPENFPKFLGFLKTRIEMGEQAYILVPAITESPDQNIKNLETTLERFKHFFPQFKVAPLHGQMKPEEKARAFKDFGEHKIDILVATSVIEVGINVTNSTIMGILNPERFGLSSLHQMRGRVGRGDKPGFCFLITDRILQPETMHRLQVIEKYNDGFKIAEEDLKIRGEGDLFGSEQSGVVTQKRISNIIMHQDILYRVIQDISHIDDLTPYQNNLASDEKIYTTI